MVGGLSRDQRTLNNALWYFLYLESAFTKAYHKQPLLVHTLYLILMCSYVSNKILTYF